MTDYFTESFAIDSAPKKLRQTADGYLVCSPRLARTGIQTYTGTEVGRPEMKEVRVYRPESEVFHVDAISSLAHKPVTIEHPSEPMTPKNWRKHAVGHLGDEVLRDGDFIRVPLIVMDAEAIDAVRKGKSQLSVGYTAVMVWADGVTPQGESYDVMQTAIRANHVAITHTARGGPKLCMGDATRSEERSMPNRTIVIDGISAEMDERSAQVVERQINKLEADIVAAKAALATAQTTTQTDVATAKTEAANAAALVQTKDAEIATLKQQLGDAKITPAKLDKLVSERVATVDRARAIIGDALVIDGKTDADMRRQVVSTKLGDTAKDWNDDMITASFNTLSVTADSGNNGNGNNGVGLSHVVHVIKNTDSLGGGDQRAKAYQTYENDLSNRWKTAGVRSPV